MSRLFGHLASKFGSSSEDLATEALCYIVKESKTTRDAFLNHVNDVAGTDLSPQMRFATQYATDGGGRPDLWGLGQDDGEQLFVESKFWAGLTGNQPIGYLKSLRDAESAVLLFLVPERRRDNVWQEVVRRSIKQGWLSERPETYAGETAHGPVLAITTWTDVLSVLEPAATSENADLVNDVRQLRGLCERQGAEAFQPFKSEDFSPYLARRILDLRGLVDDLYESMRADEISGWEWHSSGRGKGKAYRFVAHIHGKKAGIGLHYYWWLHEESSPFWIRIHTSDRGTQHSVFDAVRPEFDATEGGDYRPLHSMIPLSLPVGEEYDAVLGHLRDQLSVIARRLAPVLNED